MVSRWPKGRCSRLRLRTTIRDLAGERTEDRRALTKKAREMLAELQATPEQAILMLLETAVGRVFQRIYAGLDHEPADIDRLREASKDHTLVLLPSQMSIVEPGMANMRSRARLSKPICRAERIASRARAALWMRPRVLNSSSWKDCTPKERRLTALEASIESMAASV